MAVEWINGWEYNNDKPYIRNFDKSSLTYSSGGLTWWTWQKGRLWLAGDVTTRFKNTTQSDLKLDHIKIRTCACDSGRQSYWASNGMTTPCYGHGGEYYAYVRVSNDGGKTWESSSKHTNIIPPISGSNMNSKGSSTTRTASFGNPPFEGNKAFGYHEYIIDDCPTILPGGIVAIHLGISRFIDRDKYNAANYESNPNYRGDTLSNARSSECCIKFNLDPGDMVVQIVQEDRPYVWKLVDGKWECIKPAYIVKDGEWQALEDVMKL